MEKAGFEVNYKEKTQGEKEKKSLEEKRKEQKDSLD